MVEQADDGFLDVLFEKAQHGGCEKALCDAFRWSLPSDEAPAKEVRSARSVTA